MATGSSTRFYNFFGKEGLAGGLNVSDNPLIVGPQEMVAADNVLISQTLARKKRPGQESYNTTSFAGTASYPALGKPIRGHIQYWRTPSFTSPTLEDIVLHSDNKIWEIPNRIDAATNITGSLTIDPDGIPYYQVFEGILYFCSSTTGDGYNKVNGLGVTPVTSAATAPPDGPGSMLQVWNGRMMMAGNPDFPFRLYMSKALDAEVWTGADATSFDFDYDGDPQGIVAIFKPLQGNLYVATRRTVYEISCTDPANVATYNIAPITKGVGCVGAHAWCSTANDILFWSDRGFHSLKKTVTSDQVEFTYFSKEIQLLYTNLINHDLLDRIQVIWDQTQNLAISTMCTAGQLTNDVILCYNITFNNWTPWLGCQARSLNTILINNQEYGSNGREDGQLTFLNPNLFLDLNQPYSTNFKTGKFFPDGDIVNEKMFLSVTILVSSTQPSTLTIGYTIDSKDTQKSGASTITIGQDGATLGGTFVLGTSKLGIGRFIPIRIPINEIGYNYQFELTSSSSDFEFYGFVLEVDDANTNYR